MNQAIPNAAIAQGLLWAFQLLEVLISLLFVQEEGATKSKRESIESEAHLPALISLRDL